MRKVERVYECLESPFKNFSGPQIRVTDNEFPGIKFWNKGQEIQIEFVNPMTRRTFP